ncbi:Ice-structuring protein [uncultured Subdoligranulum sp.]|uniref:Ice-structuring protein n=1 Tax=uncultured Subdoligranulum sp. TaxID=512298 RepID=UPI0025F49E4C|nr:Ice-structuring protein [uncultured Subdoligranulum sp.]
MANYREEQIRNSRRLARQILGAAALLLALIGLFTVFGWVVSALRTALDDSGRRASYADRLYGMVMLDPMPFDDVNSVDPGVFKQAAIWGTVYEIQKNGGSLDQYERDPDTGSAMIPKLEIDTYIANLLGPNYTVTDGSFSTDEFVYQYNEEKQCYLVPVTSSVAQYTPEVEKISTSGGKMYVTVGYIPTTSNSASGELSLTAPTDPVKYMDYVFTRGDNRDWYLSALQESEMKVEATPEPSPTAAVTQDTQSMVESQLNSSMTDAASSTAGEEEAASDAAAPESSAEATTTTEETTEPSADSSSQEEPDASSDGDTASSDEAVG